MLAVGVASEKCIVRQRAGSWNERSEAMLQELSTQSKCEAFDLGGVHSREAQQKPDRVSGEGQVAV